MTGVLWTAAEAEAATGGRATRAFEATGVVIDSRATGPGDLFVALKGPRFDGHDFAIDAFARGAAAAVVSRVPKEIDASAPLLMVDDPFQALNRLAEAARARSRAKIIAVTGSVGKTGTKEALRIALLPQGRVCATEGNLNNQIGLPLSLARMPVSADFGVFELGMSRPGEIAPLSRLVRPDVAVITTIEPVHSEFFESLADIADAKAEIFAGMHGGTAVLYRENPYFPWLADAAWRAGVDTVIGFGAHPEATARLIDCELRANSSRVTAVIEGSTVTYRLSVPGRHWVMNSLAVLAAVYAAGANVVQAAAELFKLQAIKGRGRRHRVVTQDGDFELFDESYNASPASMRAAISVLASSEPLPGGRRIAVLGDMLELGPDAARLHASLANDLAAAGVDLVFTAGPNMRHLHDALPEAMRGGHAATSDALAGIVTEAVKPGDVVTVKGSFGSRMAVVVDALLALNSAPARVANGY
ncbi:MAG: UDP-N-acetylmuramoyl-tripeptide--D-alanyl-D-alanine ligase [Alphaproteobacteria bacterium]